MSFPTAPTVPSGTQLDVDKTGNAATITAPGLPKDDVGRIIVSDAAVLTGLREAQNVFQPVAQLSANSEGEHGLIWHFCRLIANGSPKNEVKLKGIEDPVNFITSLLENGEPENPNAKYVAVPPEGGNGDYTHPVTGKVYKLIGFVNAIHCNVYHNN